MYLFVFFIMSIPWKKILPSSKFNVPNKSGIKVDFPVPFGPTIVSVSPWLTLKDTLFKAVFSLYFFVTFSTLIQHFEDIK